MSQDYGLKDINVSKDVKDNLKDKKIEKLASALYLVTNFLSDSDPIKWKLREKSLDLLLLVSRSNPHLSSDRMSFGDRALSFINDLVRLIEVVIHDTQASPMNFAVLRQEYLALHDLIKRQSLGVTAVITAETGLFPVLATGPEVPEAASRVSKKNDISKNDRQTVILKSLSADNWSAIKDIAKNLPGFSRKTIQRELNLLAAAGLVRKTGERRWSRYRKA